MKLADQLDVVLDQQDGEALLGLHLAQGLGQRGGLGRGRGPTTARRAAAPWARSSAPGPTSTSRHWPRLSRSIGSSARSLEPSSSSTSSQRAISSRLGRPSPMRSFHSRPSPRRTRSATNRWSRTVDLGEQLDALERAADARAGPAGGRAAPVMSSPSSARPGRRAEHAEHAVEERRLAGAVRPDQPDPLARARPSMRHVVERDDARRTAW